MKDDNKKNFDLMGIYDLRNYARSIGVCSPTKLKRDELIQRISAIIEGGMPEQKKTNKGRPPKHQKDDNFAVEMLIPKNLFEKDDSSNYEYTFSQNLGLKNAAMLCESQNSTFDNILFSGYYKPVNDNYGFILKEGFVTKYYKENVVILNSLFNKNHLKFGDFVVGSCRYVIESNVMLATGINSINGQEEVCENRNDINRLPVLYPTCSLELSKSSNLIDAKIVDKICPIAKGAKVVVDFEDRKDIQYYEMILESLEKNNIKTMVVSIDDALEDLSSLETKYPNVDFVKHTFSQSRENFFDCVLLKINNMCREYENGKDVAIIYYDGKNYADNLVNNDIISKNLAEKDAKVIALNELKDELCIARNLSKGSITVFVFGKVDSEIQKFNNCNFIVKNMPYENTDVKIDLIKSSTKDVSKILSEDDYDKLKKFRQSISDKNYLDQLKVLFE